MLKMVDRKSGNIIWERRNQSTGQSGEISMVLPKMIEALLKDFPGESGVTKWAEIPMK